MPHWFDAGPLSALAEKGRRVVKAGGKQILVIADGGRLFACNNRCPHEGYPLSEGTLGPACTLTCNWHNWKFDLASGETLVGGDRLRRYPVEDRDGRIWIDIADRPEAERRARALANLEEACADNDYTRMAREVARFLRASGDPHEPLRHMIAESADRFEYGMTHAYAASADWLKLHARTRTEDKKLTALVEPIAHIAWDTLREPSYPYPDGAGEWSADRFIAAIEAEDESEAVARLNGALLSNALPRDLKTAFARAALAHYQDFGHSAIYVCKAFELIEVLGRDVAPPVLKALTRELIYATREDRIPEFRHYATALGRWSTRGTRVYAPEDLIGLSVNATLDRILDMEGRNEDKFRVLLEASARAMLRFDLSVDRRTDKPVSHNVSWLDFTHSLTFANAVREICAEVPDLWPAALLQMGCFLGRNTPFLMQEPDRDWSVRSAAAFLEHEQDKLFDHGIGIPIFACHRVKVLFAVETETAWAGDGSLTDAVLAAANRYLNTPMKTHHAQRSASQALQFVEAEG